MLQINTLFQLFAMKMHRPAVLEAARVLLNMPDLFNRWLTGIAKSEATIASTAQFFNPREMAWATELFKHFTLPTEILCPIVMPGTLLGNMIDAPHVPVYTV